MRLATKELTIIIVFSALAIALEPLKVPVFFWPGQYFHFWEIPAVIGFFLYNSKVSFSIIVLGSIGYAFFFPGPLGFLGPIWRIIVLSVTLFGLWIAKKVVNRNTKEPKLSPRKTWITPLVIITGVATLVRVAIAPVIDLSIYRFLFPIVLGRVYTDVYLVGLVPAMVLFNLLLSLFSVSVAYLISKKVNSALKINNNFR
jgi:riboflavin transporter FmnP